MRRLLTRLGERALSVTQSRGDDDCSRRAFFTGHSNDAG
jgi:hypothetical protein